MTLVEKYTEDFTADAIVPARLVPAQTQCVLMTRFIAFSETSLSRHSWGNVLSLSQISN